MKKIFIIAAMFATSLATYAQKAKASTVQNKPTTVSTANYSCPMHPDCTSSKPGKCSKCGMDLNLSSKEKMKMEVMKKYTCPMHPEVTSDKPGKCTKCGMNLTLSKKEQLKMEVMKKYTCPMHPEVTSDKPGKCSKCGMNMNLSSKEKMKMEVNEKVYLSHASRSWEYKKRKMYKMWYGFN